MDDILIPKERRDAVVLIGVDRNENVEFIRVYAVSEEKARETLEEFFNAKGLFPADYRLVSSGSEEVGGKRAITTKSESSLGASLSRLGLKLVSNGVLYLDGVERVYQFTLLSEELYNRLLSENEEKVETVEGEKRETGDLPLSLGEVLEMGLPVLVVNLRGMDLDDLLPEGAVLLREPPVEKAVELISKGEFLVVETVFPDKYYFLPFAVRINIPPLSKSEFARELEERVGVPVDEGLLEDYPPGLRNYHTLEFIAEVVKKLVERGVKKEEAVETAIFISLGFVPSEFRLD